MKSTFRALVLATVAAGTLSLGGCPLWNNPTNKNDNASPAGLARFGSGEELLNYFKQQATAAHRNGWLGNLFRGGGMALAPTANAEDTAGSATDAQSTDYSTTNLQEEGVDESDVFKSDGQYFYIAKGHSLRIVDATPLAELAEVGRVDFDGYVDELYLRGTKLIALAREYSTDAPDSAASMMWPPYYGGATTVVYEIDISDPAHPAITAQNALDGSRVTSRLTNDRLILVLTIATELPANPNAINIGLLTLDQVLPRMNRGAGAEPLVPPENWFRPLTPDGYYSTAVLTLDANDITDVVGSVAVLANAGTIYCSTEALYLTDTEYTEENDYREMTAIHKLAFDADGVAQPTASGKVAGRLLNQFSLSERDGYLRVATHVNNWRFFNTWGDGFAGVEIAVADTSDGVATSTDTVQNAQNTNSEPTSPYNAVYVLGESAGALDAVGALENIAPGENLYAARFLDNRAYLVTFVQIDPLFVIDLADPTQPTILGELKIPGYSDYLHPWGDNYLIGVGRAVAETSGGFREPAGVQLSLFDVSDPANPTAVDQVEFGDFGSECEVSSTHKAFTFLPNSGRLAIPVTLRELASGTDQWYYTQVAFDGVLCLQVAETGFTELGRVPAVIYDDLGWTQWRRAAFIGDDVYAVTPAGVRAANLSDFNTQTTLELQRGVDDTNYGPWWAGGMAEPGPMMD